MRAPFSKANVVAGRVGGGGRRFAEQLAEVEEVFLRGGALGALGGGPLPDELGSLHCSEYTVVRR